MLIFASLSPYFRATLQAGTQTFSGQQATPFSFATAGHAVCRKRLLSWPTTPLRYVARARRSERSPNTTIFFRRAPSVTSPPRFRHLCRHAAIDADAPRRCMMMGDTRQFQGRFFHAITAMDIIIWGRYFRHAHDGAQAAPMIFTSRDARGSTRARHDASARQDGTAYARARFYARRSRIGFYYRRSLASHARARKVRLPRFDVL